MVITGNCLVIGETEKYNINEISKLLHFIANYYFAMGDTKLRKYENRALRSLLQQARVRE